MKRVIIKAAINLKKLNITMKEFLDGKSRSIKPYEKNGSYEFIQAVKNGDEKNAFEMIYKNKFLVHDFDHVYYLVIDL